MWYFELLQVQRPCLDSSKCWSNTIPKPKVLLIDSSTDFDLAVALQPENLKDRADCFTFVADEAFEETECGRGCVGYMI